MGPTFHYYGDIFCFDNSLQPSSQLTSSTSKLTMMELCMQSARLIVQQAVWLGATFVPAVWQGEFLAANTRYNVTMATTTVFDLDIIQRVNVSLGTCTMNNGRVLWLAD